MATDRRAEVVWQGSLREGSGTIVSTTSGAIGEQPVSWPNRSEDNPDATSPEERIAAAHAACSLDEDGFREAAQTAKENCPVSKALAGVPEITLEARLT